ncbi:MAG: SHOCT domain-containing protein [Clostridia bacterium]|nr:SHOCT domain-containing protein [Clostridia bacterium]
MDKAFLKIIFSIIALLFATMTFFLYFTPFISVKVLGERAGIDGMDIIRDYFRDEDERIITTDNAPKDGELWLVFSFIFASGLFLGSILGVVLNTLKYLNVKLPHALTQQTTMAGLIIQSIFSILFASGFLALNCCTLYLVGYNDLPLVHLGGGAITSGIFAVIISIILIVSNFVTFDQQNEYVAVNQKKSKPNTAWISQLKEMKELYDSGILSEEEYNEEKKRIMRCRNYTVESNVMNHNVQIIERIDKKLLSGKYVAGNVTIIIENESFFTIKSKGLMISQGRVKEENDTVVFSTKDNKKMTFNRQGDDLVSLKGVVYVKK